MNADGGGKFSGRHRIPSISRHAMGGSALKKCLLFWGMFALILTACREETDFYFYTNQNWKLESALTVDKAVLDLLMGAGGMAIGSNLGIPVPDTILQSENWISLSLDWIVSEYRNQGLDANWRQRSNTYTLSVKGGRFSDMPGVAMGLITLEKVSGTDDQYHLQMQALNLDMGEMEQGIMALPGLGYDRIVTLHAAKIIQSNADEVSGGKAVWHNPGLVDVVFEPANPFPLPILFIFLCLGGISIPISLAVKGLGGSKCPACGRRVRKGQEICPHCGGYLSYAMIDI